MSVEEFIAECEKSGLHFTANWTKKRLQEIESKKATK